MQLRSKRRVLCLGKTTLLDTLAGRVQGNVNVTGSIRVNGKHVKMSYGTVAYVPQEDLLTGTLSVRETLEFTARLRYATLLSLVLTAGH